MMEPDDENRAAALWPDPPHFWKSFTPSNVSRFETIKQEYADQHNVDPNTITRLPDLPSDLLYLQPPPEPEDAQWRLFSEPQSLTTSLQSLETAGILRLAPSTLPSHTDRAFELKKLAKSLLLNFLELVALMGHNPSLGEQKVQDLKTLFLNFHHVLNEYRPHQAREQLIELMQDQLDGKHAETAAIRGVVDRAKRVLEGLGSMEISGGTGTGEKEEEEGAKGGGEEVVVAEKAEEELERGVWRGLERFL